MAAASSSSDAWSSWHAAWTPPVRCVAAAPRAAAPTLCAAADPGRPHLPLYASRSRSLAPALLALLQAPGRPARRQPELRRDAGGGPRRLRDVGPERRGAAARQPRLRRRRHGLLRHVRRHGLLPGRRDALALQGLAHLPLHHARRDLLFVAASRARTWIARTHARTHARARTRECFVKRRDAEWRGEGREERWEAAGFSLRCAHSLTALFARLSAHPLSRPLARPTDRRRRVRLPDHDGGLHEVQAARALL